jgi:hypothetical protein
MKTSSLIKTSAFPASIKKHPPNKEKDKEVSSLMVILRKKTTLFVIRESQALPGR